MANLKDLFIDELKDMHDAENRISKALPKMAKAANDKLTELSEDANQEALTDEAVATN